MSDTVGDLTSSVANVLDLRLDPLSPAPLIVGLSGGGDSLALLLMADAWARRCSRDLIVVTIDHDLQAQSAVWSQSCSEIAHDLGRRFVGLSWRGPKPKNGLPAAARLARHRLLADAARDVGARVVLLGHTADDVAEAGAMRAAGSTTPTPRAWAPSPVWPEGRGVFICRPMLGLRRAAIRDWLRARGRVWIDDPANDDPAYARTRARATLAARPDWTAGESAFPADVIALAQDLRDESWGGLRLDRAALRAAAPRAAGHVVAAACLCAAGASRPPSSDRLIRLVEAIAGTAAVTATLCGARIEAQGETVMFMREPGELKRRGVAAQSVASTAPMVWDGRFELYATLPGLVVQPLAGLAARLGDNQRQALGHVPANGRGGLPVVRGDLAGLACPVLEPIPGLTIKALAFDRVRAACGLVQREP